MRCKTVTVLFKTQLLICPRDVSSRPSTIGLPLVEVHEVNKNIPPTTGLHEVVEIPY